jgi:hypothetical protein
LVLLNRAHALQPGNGQITYHLAVALDANAKRNEARKLLKSLLDRGLKFTDRPAAGSALFGLGLKGGLQGWPGILPKRKRAASPAALLFYPTTFIQFSFSLNSIFRQGP